MIVSRQKPAEEILEELRPHDSVFIVGCGRCATVCKSGGEDEVRLMAEALAAAGKRVTGTVVLEETCHTPKTQLDLRKRKEELAETDAVLVLACGGGTQSVAASVQQPVVAGTDTLFLGNTRRFGQFEQRCSLCGGCLLSRTEGICTVTLCSKGIMNGPCGGMDDGRCETGSGDCAWYLVYRKLKERGLLERLSLVQQPRDHSRCDHPSSLSGGK